MKTVLVTGGLGFLGSHLVERLVEIGDVHIHIVDNMTSHAVRDQSVFLSRLTACSVEVMRASVASLAAYTSRPRFDEIYHLASPGPVGVLQHAGRIASNVIADTTAMIDMALADGARLCDVSTSEVYGGGRGGLCTETDPKVVTAKVSARLEYAVAKLAAEVALINTTRMRRFHGVVVRPFNIAGPRQSAAGGFVLPRFIQQALADEPLTVYGTGSAVRAFTHVRDVADGVIRALRMGRSGEAYNLGNAANKTTILDLAGRVMKLVSTEMGRGGVTQPIRYVDPKELHGPMFEEADDKYPDASLAERELGWHPQHGLDAIVTDTIRYIRHGRRD